MNKGFIKINSAADGSFVSVIVDIAPGQSHAAAIKAAKADYAAKGYKVKSVPVSQYPQVRCNKWLLGDRIA